LSLNVLYRENIELLSEMDDVYLASKEMFETDVGRASEVVFPTTLILTTNDNIVVSRNFNFYKSDVM